MLIVSIKTRGSKVILGLEDGQRAVLSLEIFMKSALRKGDDLTEQDLAELMLQDEIRRGKEYALYLLARRMHSIHEICLKMHQKEYSQTAIDATIKTLSESNYLNDEAFAIEYVRQKMEKSRLGHKRLKLELLKKKIDEKIIARVFDALTDEQERENAALLFEKKMALLKKRGLENEKIKRRLFMFMTSRGFEYNLIKELMKKHLNLKNDADNCD